MFVRCAVLVLIAAMLPACRSHDEQALRTTLAAHDAALREMPRDFYEPGLGDLMNSLQLRHAKLWFAGQADNWPLAAFELEEIHESLGRVSRWHAGDASQPIAALIKAHTHAGVYALDQSIRQHDRAASAWPSTSLPTAATGATALPSTGSSSSSGLR
jgi:hypothetical protein